MCIRDSGAGGGHSPKADGGKTLNGGIHAARCGGKLSLIHILIKADVETEVSPIIGNEEQSWEFIDRLIADYESEPEKIWDLNIFGRTLSSMAVSYTHLENEQPLRLCLLREFQSLRGVLRR